MTDREGRLLPGHEILNQGNPEEADDVIRAKSLIRRMFFPEDGKSPLYFHALRRDVVLCRTGEQGGWAITIRQSAIASGMFWKLDAAKCVEDLNVRDVAFFVDAVIAWSV